MAGIVSTNASSTTIQFATASSDKQLCVWRLQLDNAAAAAAATDSANVSTVACVERVTFKKKLTFCAFAGDGVSLLVGDKFGDGFVVRLGSLQADEAQEPQFGSMATLTSMVKLLLLFMINVNIYIMCVRFF